MKLVNRSLMRDIDGATIDGTVSGVAPIPVLELMETAGMRIAEALAEDFLEGLDEAIIAVFCGKGNNGGDGLVAARYLAEWGDTVNVYVVGKPDELSPASQTNLKRLAETSATIKHLEDCSSLPEEYGAHVFVDALLGSGASGAPKGLVQEIVRYLNKQEFPICAIDNPTGLDIDTGEPHGDCIVADFTYALALPKVGHYVYPGRFHAGVARVLDIGIPQEVVDSFAVRDNLITPEYVSEHLPSRPPQAHKGTFGRLFTLAGSKGMTGAGTLAAQAALRSGVGIVTVGCPDTLEPIFETKLTEAMTLGLPSVAKRGALSMRALGDILTALKKSTAAIIGPGLGRHRETSELIRRLVARIQVPAVIDADGLNAFEGDTSALEDSQAPFVLTPHDGEFARLTGEAPPTVYAERAECVRAAAQKFNCVVLLKGAPTLIASPDGEVHLNPTGNSGMATGGSGDVLSGVIGALLAQDCSPLSAAICGAYLHGLAGDFAALEFGERSLIAGDLTDFLAETFAMVE